VFDGNRGDVTTVEEIIETMREKYGHERRVWVMDRGMVSEENLEQLRAWNASYLVGTPKSMLKHFERELLDEEWTALPNGVEVKLCQAPDGSPETFVLCRAEGRMEKDRAIRRRQVERMQAALDKLQLSATRAKRQLRDRGLAERRLGRLLERYPRAARFFDVSISEQPDPAETGKTRLLIHVSRHDERGEWADLTDGCYLLRTNLPETNAGKLWEIYIGLTQVEFSFRVTKSDLAIRPIYHHHEDRAQAHVLICFLALTMWRALEQWMKACGLGNCPRKVIEELSEVRSMDVVLPTKAGHDLRLRVISRPEPRLAQLLDLLDLPLPNRPKMIADVVPKMSV
jgi:transposase